MATQQPAAGDIAARVRAALQSANLEALRDLLDPDVRWGPPDDPETGCRSRDEVLAWYRRAKDQGAQAAVTEVVEGAGTLLVGLRVSGTRTAAEQGGEADRWQVLTLANGRVVDIRGFDDREAAAARAGVTR
jgi:ketosteroid isomerase-like protein